MADVETQQILEEWGLGSLIDTFPAEGIGLEALNALVPGSNFVQKLLKNELLGVQIKFERNLNNYVSNETPQVPLKSVTIESTNETSKPSNYSKDKKLGERIANKSTNSENEIIATFNDTSGENLLEINKENVEPQTEETSLTKKEFFDNLPSLDFYQILFDTFKGRVILNVSDKKEELSDSDQSSIVDIIVSHLLCFTDPFGQPFQFKNFHCEIVAKKICELCLFYESLRCVKTSCILYNVNGDAFVTWY